MSEQTGNTQLSPQEREKKGQALREQTPLKSHGDWKPADDRPDPLSLLQAQDKGRMQHLLPIKYGRMVASPFTFLRGSAVVMASDLASTPVTGLNVVLCGDAHLDNFGVFATPERELVFDVNDFDETYIGPWEWDLKRLAASAVIAGRANGFSDKTNKKLARAVSRAYRKAMQNFAAMSIMEVWYFSVDAHQVVDLFDKYSKKSAKSAKKSMKKARLHTSQRTLDKLTHFVDGKRQFVNNPPLLVRLTSLLSDEQKSQITKQDIEDFWNEYVNSVSDDRRRLLRRFRMTDSALRVGGVGSVGTRCTIILLEGDTEQDSIILQQKEADHSSLEAYLPKRDISSQAERVVVGQRLMQASSDIFLGQSHGSLTGQSHEYYWRQLKDMKGSFDTAQFDAKGLGTYLAVCAGCLARAQARTGDAAAISGYVGTDDSSNAFDKAIAKFSVTYADQTEKDHQTLVDAINNGKIIAQTGV